ncbi:MAG: putative Beta-lactamase [Herbinix sp.]|jgi:CubicO group peptidase (beta-lactamase class C family)|nr:putative Beta-lactamase [Herbinix sp.]
MEFKKLEQLSVVIQKEIDQGELSGAAIRVIHNNETLYQDELGYADMEKKVPTDRNTIYRMFSMTKPVTAVATMILYERGQLNLLAPVGDYLEGFQDQQVYTEKGLIPVERPATIQDLLNMTSGIAYPDESFEVGRRMQAVFSEVEKSYHEGINVGTVEFANRIGRVPLEFHPGNRWRYGASADILGAVIEVISGKSFGQFLKDEIFNPLNMTDTDFYVPKYKLDRFSKAYDYNFETNALVPFTNDMLAIFDYLTPPAFESGGAGLVSTMKDYSRFALMLANGGVHNGVRILGRKTVEYLSTPQLTPAQSVTFNWDPQAGYNYGNLMRSMVDPVKAASNGSVGEFGWDGWTGNYFLVDPKENLVMLYMIQRCGGTNPTMFRKLRSIIYGAL